MDFDFRDLDFLIQNSENFSANSKEAQQIDAGFGFLERAFTEKTKLLDEQHFVQSLIIIAIYLTASGKSAGSLAADWSRGFFMTK